MFRSQSIFTRFRASVSLGVLLFSYAAMAQDSALRKTFEAIYAKRDQSLRVKDADAINAFLSYDYTEKGLNGDIRNRAQVIGETNAVIRAIEGAPSYVSQLETVRQGANQNEAIVEFSDFMKGTVKLPDGVLHTFETKGRARDTWVRTGGSWKLKYHEVLEGSGLVDGKPTQPTPAKVEVPVPARPNSDWSQTQTQIGGNAKPPQSTVGEGAASVEIKFDNWEDPTERSFTVEVPHGWQVTGGVSWTGPVDAQRWLRAKSPDGTILIYIGDPKILPFQVPDYSTPREGAVVQSSRGSVQIQRFLKGVEYAKQYVALGRPCQSAPRFVNESNLPDLANSIAQTLEPQGRAYNLNFAVTAGEAGFLCENVQGFARATTLLGRSPASAQQFWGVIRVAGFVTSDPMKSMEARYIMEHALGTMNESAAWNQAYDEKVMRTTGVLISMQNAQFQVQQNAYRNSQNYLSSLNHPNSGVPSRSGPKLADSSGNRRMCDGIGRATTVSNTSGPVFINHSGNIGYGSGSGAAPDNSGVWTQLHPCP